jgi:PadR family transcriptional regulator, regulatory protein PadR
MCHKVYGIWYINMNNEIFQNLKLELRRGFLVIAVLAKTRKEQYGYTLRKSLNELGIDIEESSLYPMLRRLEIQGLLISKWREEDKRKKRFYQISTEGELILNQLTAEWKSINSSLEGII